MGVQPGYRVSPLTVVSTAGQEVSLPATDAPRTVLVLLESGCAPCGGIMRQLIESGWPSSVPPLYVVLPDQPDSVAFADGLRNDVRVGYQRGRQLFAALRTNVSPVAYVLDSSRRVLAVEVPAGVTSPLELAAGDHSDDLASQPRPDTPHPTSQPNSEQSPSLVAVGTM